MSSLNARQVDTAKPRDKPYKLSDGGGLYLLINTNGSKYWKLKYRISSKEKKLSFGVYPDVSLADARNKRDEARKIIATGEDPSEVKKSKQIAKKLFNENTFEAIAIEWYTGKISTWSKNYASYVIQAFKNNVFPFIGNRPISDIKPLELLALLQRIEKRNAPQLASKVRQLCGEAFRYAIITGRAEYNPAPDLASAMQSYQKQHNPFLLVQELPEFLNKLTQYTGSFITHHATRLLMLTGLRTTELRSAEWIEIDFDKMLWEIPKSRMKMKRNHLVPLSQQALITLRCLQHITGGHSLIFPGRNDSSKPMSVASINQLLRALGYNGKATGHGFRHTMSTILHEQGYNTAWIESQLAHADKNSIRGTYNHAQYLDGRREMLQWYADYIDKLEKEGVVC